jgi:hypothetical protein
MRRGIRLAWGKENREKLVMSGWCDGVVEFEYALEDRERYGQRKGVARRATRGKGAGGLLIGRMHGRKKYPGVASRLCFKLK